MPDSNVKTYDVYVIEAPNKNMEPDSPDYVLDKAAVTSNKVCKITFLCSLYNNTKIQVLAVYLGLNRVPTSFKHFDFNVNHIYIGSNV